MNQRGWKFSILALILASTINLSGCATKRYVRKEVGKLEPKIAANSDAIRDTNEKLDGVDRRVQQNTTDIAATDRTATMAAQQAAAALQAANSADSRSAAALAAANGASQSAQQAYARANSIDAQYAKMGSYVDAYTIGEPQMIVFGTGSDVLNDAARSTLDAVANRVAGQQSGYLIEIHGFTDTTGSEKQNVALSQQRADSALRYLVSRGVPVYRTSLVGLGEQSPVADNSSEAGRQQNRRVEVRILRVTTTGNASN